MRTKIKRRRKNYINKRKKAKVARWKKGDNKKDVRKEGDKEKKDVRRRSSRRKKTTEGETENRPIIIVITK